MVRLSSLTGPDASILQSLQCYGFAWRENKGVVEFFYGVKTNSSGDYIEFDNSFLPNDLDVEKEFKWINLNHVTSWAGCTNEEWLNLPLTQKIQDLCHYYGHENIFGSDFGGNFKLSKSGKSLI